MDTSKLVKIKCRRIVDKNPKSKTFGKICTKVLAYADRDGHIYIECPDCKNFTQIKIEGILPEKNKV